MDNQLLLLLQVKQVDWVLHVLGIVCLACVCRNLETLTANQGHERYSGWKDTDKRTLKPFALCLLRSTKKLLSQPRNRSFSSDLLTNHQHHRFLRLTFLLRSSAAPRWSLFKKLDLVTFCFREAFSEAGFYLLHHEVRPFCPGVGVCIDVSLYGTIVCLVKAKQQCLINGSRKANYKEDFQDRISQGRLPQSHSSAKRGKQSSS